MNEEKFERRLRSQRLRGIPQAWREEILAAAGVNRRVTPACERTLVDVLRLRWRELFWPAPQAWAGLAAIWLAILGVNFATWDPAPMDFARRTPPAAPLLRELLKEQQQLFAELVGPMEMSKAERSKPAAAPRSQGRQEFLNT
jgi:hypothetical protein